MLVDMIDPELRHWCPRHTWILMCTRGSQRRTYDWLQQNKIRGYTLVLADSFARKCLKYKCHVTSDCNEKDKVSVRKINIQVICEF